MLLRSPPPCSLWRRGRGRSEPRVKPKNVSPEQVLLCSTSLAPAWRPPAHPHSPGSREGSEPAARGPAWKGAAPGRVRNPRDRASLFCAPLLPRPPIAPWVLRAPRLSPRRLKGWRHGRERRLQGSRNVLPGELLCASSLVLYSWKQLLQPRNARMPRYWGAWTLGCLCLGSKSPAAFRVHHLQCRLCLASTHISGSQPAPPSALRCAESTDLPPVQIMRCFPPRPEAGQGDAQGADSPCTCEKCSHRTFPYQTLIPPFAPEARAQREGALLFPRAPLFHFRTGDVLKSLWILSCLSCRAGGFPCSSGSLIEKHRSQRQGGLVFLAQKGPTGTPFSGGCLLLGELLRRAARRNKKE